MPPERGDPAHLLDMLEAARLIVDFMAGKNREDFRGSSVLRAAVERKIEIIGEAAPGFPIRSVANTQRFPGRRLLRRGTSCPTSIIGSMKTRSGESRRFIFLS